MKTARHISAAVAGLILAAAALASCSKSEVSFLFGTWRRQSCTVTIDGATREDSSPATLRFKSDGKVHYKDSQLDTTYYYAYNLELGVISFNTTGYYMEHSGNRLQLERNYTETAPDSTKIQIARREIYIKK